MESLRLRYEGGRFTPLDPMPEMEEGQEIVVTAWSYTPADEAFQTMLAQTRGLWADWPEIDDLLAEARDKRDQPSQSSS